MKKWQTQYARHTVKPEVNNLPSKTIPDQSMSVAEIMRRYASGLPISGQRVPMYEGEETFMPPNWERMDISEQQDYLAAHAERIQEMKKDLEDQQAKRGRYAPRKKAQDKQPDNKENQQAAPSAAQDDSKKDQPNGK